MAQESPLSATGALTEDVYEMMAAATQPDGLVGHPADPAPVRVEGGQVIVRAGLSGVLRGFPWRSGDTDTAYTPTVSGPARTDLVVLRLDRQGGYSVHTEYRVGTSTSPPAPESGTGPDDPYEIPLADIGVSPAGPVVQRIRAWFLGPEGQILCTGDSLPIPTPGRRIRRTDLGRTYEASGSRWVPALEDTGNTSFPFASGWTAAIRTLSRRNDMVFFALSPQRTGNAIAANQVVHLGNLPAGFRSATQFEGLADAPSSGRGRYVIHPSGRVEVVLYSGLEKNKFVNLHPVMFPAGEPVVTTN